jgi:hypothetical protein
MLGVDMTMLRPDRGVFPNRMTQGLAPTGGPEGALMVVFSLLGRPTQVRWANVIVPAVYLLFNIGFLLEATQAWEYYLGVFYVLFNVLIMWRAYKWPTDA